MLANLPARRYVGRTFSVDAGLDARRETVWVRVWFAAET